MGLRLGLAAPAVILVMLLTAAPGVAARAPRYRATVTRDSAGIPHVAARDIGYKVPESSPYCTRHFCVHYVREGPDAPNLADTGGVAGVPDYVETVAAAAELARSVENVRLHWRLPKGDGRLGGGTGLTDLYLEDMSGFANGGTSDDGGYKGPSKSAYIELDKGLETDIDNGESVWTTVAHEYNHVLQAAYDARVGGWMAESTATWAADQVRAQSSIPRVFDWATMTQTPLSDAEKQYGTVVWNHWLVARYGKPVVREAWRLLPTVRPAGYEFAAYDRAIRNSRRTGFRARGPGFAREFATFAVASAEWRARGFPESRVYPDVVRRGTLMPGARYARRLSHASYLLLDVPRTGAATLVVEVSAKKGTTSAFALVGRAGGRDDGRVTTRLKFLPRGGSAHVELKNAAAFERVTAVLVNADVSQAGRNGRGDWRYTAERRRLQVKLKAA